ncbi:MAG: MBL fold metallo-hydrolase [Clostridia bacterium]|nr:MBL fold metallo-hydrolase [Clostridia bacterium]
MSIQLSPLFSGSSGNAVYLSDGTTSILIDGGVSAKRIVHALTKLGVAPDSLSAILVTHEHRDHTYGIGPLARAFSLPIYATRGTWCGMQNMVGDLKKEQRYALSPNQRFKIGTLNLCAVPIPHDANEPVCYTVFADNHKVSLATDMGHIEPGVVEALSGSNLVLLEANHDLKMLEEGSYPVYLKRRIAGANGHLSNDSAATVACMLAERGTKEFLLAHLSLENNEPKVAKAAVENALRASGFKACVAVAAREEDGRLFKVE